MAPTSAEKTFDLPSVCEYTIGPRDLGDHCPFCWNDFEEDTPTTAHIACKERWCSTCFDEILTQLIKDKGRNGVYCPKCRRHIDIPMSRAEILRWWKFIVTWEELAESTYHNKCLAKWDKIFRDQLKIFVVESISQLEIVIGSEVFNQDLPGYGSAHEKWYTRTLPAELSEDIYSVEQVEEVMSHFSRGEKRIVKRLIKMGITRWERWHFKGTPFEGRLFLVPIMPGTHNTPVLDYSYLAELIPDNDNDRDYVPDSEADDDWEDTDGEDSEGENMSDTDEDQEISDTELEGLNADQDPPSSDQVPVIPSPDFSVLPDGNGAATFFQDLQYGLTQAFTTEETVDEDVIMEDAPVEW